MTDDLERNERGFAIYGRIFDERGTVLRVQESSAAGRPHAYPFVDGDPKVYADPKAAAPHLTVEQAKAAIIALQRFVDHAEDSTNWRNQPDYIAAWG